MRIYLLMLLSVFLFVFSLQSKVITGRVIDSDGKGIPSATVLTNITSVSTTTDAEGNFRLQTSEEINRITVSSVGFQARQLSLKNLPENIKLETRFYHGTDILVTAERAKPGITPMANSNLSAEEIKREHTVGEFPLLLNKTPNLYAYSDGGTSLGYSYLSIRGFTGQQVSTYINGVPLNDPEDHFTYFVDLPDFASNITDIQVQRGVGNSPTGATSFGGSIDVVTNLFGRKQQTVLTTGYGEYTHNGKFFGRDISKQSIEYSSGLVDGRWSFYSRFSNQSTSGYRANSWYNGWAYYIAAGRLDPNMTTELHLYGGPIRMHLAYQGVSREDLEANWLTNYATYGNETDNFNQPHYQLHNRIRLNDNATLSNTLFYIRGKGYYEQAKSNRSYSNYNLTSISDSTNGDLIRQSWVEKSQIGWNPRLDIVHDRGSHTIGGSFYTFKSDHWGQVLSAQFLNGPIDPTRRYAQYFGKKRAASIFMQEYYKLTDKLSTQLTAQLSYESYKMDQLKIGAFLGHDYDLDWLFFSPRIGFNYLLNRSSSIYFNFAVASRAPNDYNIYDANDPGSFPQLEILQNSGDTLYNFGDPTIASERVLDFELGFNHQAEKYNVSINTFLMKFADRNLFAGNKDEFGRDITINIDRSIHAGVEVGSKYKPSDAFTFSGSFAFNYSRVTADDNQLIYFVDTSFIDPNSGNLVSQISESIDLGFKDNKVPGFPDLLTSLSVFYEQDWFSMNFTNQIVGRQYVDGRNIKELSIEPYSTVSISLNAALNNFINSGKLIITFKVDNLFDSKHEVSGYGGSYAYRENNKSVQTGNWSEYYIGAERSFYGQLKLELF